VNIVGDGDFTPSSGSTGLDTITTAWSNESSSAITYNGNSDSGGDDTITVVFTPDQLSEILADTTMQNALRAFLANPSTTDLDLSGSSWNAIVQDYEVAHISLATGYGTGVFNVDSIMMPTPPLDNSPDADTNADLVIGTSGANSLNGGAGSGGNNGNDVLVGLGGNDTLDGGSGADLLLGGDGDDTLIGGAGNDVMAGGAGADHFRINATTEGLDHILDFSNAEGDSIDIALAGFGGAGLAVGTLPDSQFGSSNSDTFGSTSERFHFNTSTHTLLYDSNGSAGGGTQVQLAVIENGNVDAAHIHIV
jgi:Ca2+-binding RTX toxin-like protein